MAFNMKYISKICNFYAYHNSTIKNGATMLVMSYKHLKLKLRVFLASHIVAMVTCYIKRMTATCLSMIWHFYDTIIVASLVKQWWYFQIIAVRKVLETVTSLLYGLAGPVDSTMSPSHYSLATQFLQLGLQYTRFNMAFNMAVHPPCVLQQRGNNDIC